MIARVSEYAASGRLLDFAFSRLGRRVDHRVAVLPLLRIGALALGRADEPRLDAELTEPEALVLVEVHDRPRQQVVVVMAGVLEQVPAQLLGQG